MPHENEKDTRNWVTRNGISFLLLHLMLIYKLEPFTVDAYYGLASLCAAVCAWRYCTSGTKVREAD